jgi:hypothetical protein
MLNYFQHRAGGRGDDESKFGAALNFIDDHGQSLDWLIRGDPAGMICAAAARSTAAMPQFDPTFAAIDAAREVELLFAGIGENEKAPPEALQQLGAVQSALARTIPTTPAGLVALTGFLRWAHTDRSLSPYFDDEEDANAFAVSLDAAVRRLSALNGLAARDHSDPVIALADRVMETRSQARAACSVFGPFEEIMFEWCHKNPRPVQRRTEPNPKSAFYFGKSKFLDIETGEKCDPFPGEDAAHREHEAAMKKWKRRERDAKRRCGYTKASKESEAADCAYFDATNALVRAKPRTLEGLLAKARVAQTTDPMDDLDRSIVENLAEMFGGEAVAS